MPSSTAWILDFAGGFQAAVGELELVYLIQFPALIDIPQTPFYCRHALIWEEDILPVMDLGALLAGHIIHNKLPLAGIFAYQQQAETRLHYGAIPLSAIPKRRQVRDEQACELPRQPSVWQAVAISCFSDGDRIIPILNLPYIFSNTSLRDRARI